MKPTPEWHMVNYGDDWYGLKAGDGIRRGVPEGTSSQWAEVVSAMRTGGAWSDRRLKYAHGWGIWSPRNTNDSCDIFQTDDADLIERLLAASQEWREDGLRT